MASILGFKDYTRKNFKLRPKDKRIRDNDEVYKPLSDTEMKKQAARCMDCGTTFCSWGCPLGNSVSYWNQHAKLGEWEAAYKILSKTSNFPEFTSRICPGLCEASCTLGINRESVSIREIEFTIIEKAFDMGLVKPRKPLLRTGKRVAIIGSGPAGLTVADELNAVGHSTTVFERNPEVGGLLRYGIPNFKLEKWVIDRRVELMKISGITFKTNTEVGSDVDILELREQYDAIVMTGGSTVPRNLEVPGRNYEGIHYAVDYLTQHVMRIKGENIEEPLIDAKDKTVVVIGGGDTGSDCIGTAVRQGAKIVHQLEIMPKPSEEREASAPWPTYPKLYQETSSHKEGCVRKWNVLTDAFIGEQNRVKALRGHEVLWSKGVNGRLSMKDLEESTFEIQADLVLLAMGFLHPNAQGVIDVLGLELDAYGNVKTDERFRTSLHGVFSAGDMHSGQSLVVKAIQEGRSVARSIDLYLEEESFLLG